MPSQKAQKKITDYFPPAPTVEDDHSPSPSNRDLYDDNHDLDDANREFEETYAQVCLAFNQLGNYDNSQEAEEPIEVSKEDIPNPLFTPRKCPPPERSPNPASSPHTQSQNSSPQTTSSRFTTSIYATQDPAVGTTEYCYTIPIPIIVQETAAPLAFSSPSSLLVPQQSQHSSARSPSQHTRNSPSSHISSTSGDIKNKCSSKSNGRSSGTYFSHDSTDYISVQQKDPSQSQKPQSQPGRRHHRRRRPCCRHECNVPASAQHSGSNAGGSGSGSKCSGNGDDREWTAVDSEVYMAFAQVFNATKRIEVDLLELRKLVEGLWKERFGSRG